ncbi:hypothetical protein chiPu_0006998 [Chiloscyllium punctatum]|uniref:Chemokine interleukin-8-like domain-containing protein n=1 Tax=Chiloscyllium punctatum TaxID=137246 RepID=A0A401SDS6_CHIPU|nr:hypothetical protein [Chiloscyllium punctatum]
MSLITETNIYSLNAAEKGPCILYEGISERNTRLEHIYKTSKKMNCKLQAITLLALAFVCAESTVNPPRCLCLNVVKKVPHRLIEDYLIIPKETHCSKTQIILVVNVNNSQMETCLDPGTNQGRALVECWERIGHDITRKRECIPLRKRGTNN